MTNVDIDWPGLLPPGNPATVGKLGRELTSLFNKLVVVSEDEAPITNTNSTNGISVANAMCVEISDTALATWSRLLIEAPQLAIGKVTIPLSFPR